MAEALKPVVRLVRKQPYDEQVFIDQDPATLPSLSASSVRVQAVSLGFSANNLSYCALGDALHWFDLYSPSIASLPGPFDNSTEYAVAPGWGYARVLESTISELKTGTILYGMFPTSNMIVDLKLKSAAAPGHWTEYSDHRDQVMALYCRYLVADEDFGPSSSEYSRLWKAALFPAWKSGYLLNRYVFSSRSEDPVTSTFPPVVPWSEADADLSNAVVITLASGSKTCRSFVHQMCTNRAAGSPLALLEVTSSKSSPTLNLQPSFHHQIISYEEICTHAVLQQQIVDANAKKVVILDFGGRGTALEQINDFVKHQTSIEIKIVAVGSANGKVHNTEDIQKRMARNAGLKTSQMNATNILDAVMERIGEQEAYRLIHQEWDKICREQQKIAQKAGRANAFLGMDLDVRHGVRGEGVEKTWKELCVGKATGSTGCVVQF